MAVNKHGVSAGKNLQSLRSGSRTTVNAKLKNCSNKDCYILRPSPYAVQNPTGRGENDAIVADVTLLQHYSHPDREGFKNRVGTRLKHLTGLEKAASS